MVRTTQFCCLIVCLSTAIRSSADTPTSPDIELRFVLDSGEAEVEISRVEFTGTVEKIDVSRGKEGGFTGEIALTGDIKISGPSFKGTADRLRYVTQTRLLTLTAKPGSHVRIVGTKEHTGSELEARTIQWRLPSDSRRAPQIGPLPFDWLRMDGNDSEED